MTDLLGNEINVGDDAVVCCHEKYSRMKMKMVKGTVYSITDKMICVTYKDGDKRVYPDRIVSLSAYERVNSNRH